MRNGNAQVATSLGVMHHIDAGPLKADADVACCIRPEQIRIMPADSRPREESDNMLPATIISSMYLGEIRQYTCALGEDEPLLWKITSLANEYPDYKPKDKVQLCIPARNVALLDK